jgi:methyltransferase (TIGR00027 family)
MATFSDDRTTPLEGTTSTTISSSSTTMESSTTSERDMSAADTCRRVAAIRALAHENPDCPYQEPLAALFAGSSCIEQVRATTTTASGERYLNPVVMRSILMDVMIMEDYQKHRATADSPYQIVLLGAGMDTKAYRWATEMPHSKWFEVDQAEVVEMKEQLLQEIQPAEENMYVHVERLKLDLSQDLPQLFPRLQERGFDPTASSLFVMEGLLYYIPPEGIESLFQELTFATDSRWLVSMITHEMLANVRTRDHPFFRALQKIWHSDLDDLERILAKNQKAGTIVEPRCTRDKKWYDQLVPGWNPNPTQPDMFQGTELVFKIE